MRLIRLVVMGLLMSCLGLAAAGAWLIPAPRVRRRCIRRLRQSWARCALRLMRIRVRVEPPGAVLSDPVLYVANHIGYPDILVLMSVCPGVFISKLGVLWWPFFGQLAFLGETLFVNRRKRLGIGRIVDKVRDRLRSGGSVVFFPEATSSDGESLLTFKSSLFAAADGGDGRMFAIRPLVVRYETIGGEPVTRANRDRIFWYGDMPLLGHMWGQLGAPGIDVVIRVLPERTLPEDRHEFAGKLREEMLSEIRIPETVG